MFNDYLVRGEFVGADMAQVSLDGMDTRTQVREPS